MPLPRAPEPRVRAEIADALSRNAGRLGQVYRLIQEGLASNQEITRRLPGTNDGAVGNERFKIEMILDPTASAAKARCKQAGSSVGTLLRDNAFSEDTVRYLNSLRS